MVAGGAIVAGETNIKRAYRTCVPRGGGPLQLWEQEREGEWTETSRETSIEGVGDASER